MPGLGGCARDMVLVVSDALSVRLTWQREICDCAGVGLAVYGFGGC